MKKEHLFIFIAIISIVIGSLLVKGVINEKNNAQVRVEKYFAKKSNYIFYDESNKESVITMYIRDDKHYLWIRDLYFLGILFCLLIFIWFIVGENGRKWLLKTK